LSFTCKSDAICYHAAQVAEIVYILFGAFAKLRRPSAWNNSAPTGRILMKFGIWV